MSIQRYDAGPQDIFRDKDGDYVTYSDHVDALTAERERADMAEKATAHWNRLMLERGVDIENLWGERDEMRARVARLVRAIEDAPHDMDCAYVIHTGPVTRYGVTPCNCWKRTALGGK